MTQKIHGDLEVTGDLTVGGNAPGGGGDAPLTPSFLIQGDGTVASSMSHDIDDIPYASGTSYLVLGTSCTEIPYKFALSSLSGTVAIPSSVTSIVGGAFESTYELAAVFIPGSVTSIGNYAFAYSALTKVYTDAPKSLFDAQTNIFEGVSSFTMNVKNPAANGWTTGSGQTVSGCSNVNVVSWDG